MLKAENKIVVEMGQNRKESILSENGKHSKQRNTRRVQWSNRNKEESLPEQTEADPNTGIYRQPTQEETLDKKNTGE